MRRAAPPHFRQSKAKERMMRSSDEMPKEEGAALDTVADRIITIMEELIAERDRIWVLSRKAAFPE